LSAKTARGRLYTQVLGVLFAGPFVFLLGHTDSGGVLVAPLILFGAG